MKRRNVFRVGIVYLAVAWLVLQVIDTIAPLLDLSVSLQRAVLILLAVGFPVAVLLAWALELTPTGLRRDAGGQSVSHGRKSLDYVIVIVLAAAITYFAIDKFFLSAPDRVESIEASIAVLPFTNMTQDAGNEPFIFGLHDDLLTQLSRIQSVRTVSRTSMLQYRNTTKSATEIAAELGVATILESGVQRSGDRIRINVQLIDGARDEHIWAETYDRELTAANVFEIQSDISRAIASQLRAALTPDEEQRLNVVPTQNMAALDAYFLGKRMLEDRTRESLAAAVEYFEKVVDMDPEFALGWSGLADAYMLLPEYSPTVDLQMVGQRSRAAVARALALDADIPEVRSSEAWHQLIHNYDWEGAEKTFREALRIVSDNPNVLHWLSHTLSWQGRFEEAISFARRAIEADPQSRMMRTNLAYILVDAGEFDEALEVAWSMRDTEPDYTVQRRNLFFHELRAGRLEDAAQTFVAYTRVVGGDPDAAREIGDMFIAFAATGEVGRISEDLVARAQLGTEDLAQVLAFVGDGEGALSALAEAVETRSGSRSVLSMKINPAYDFIRDDPRFISLLQEVGLAN